MSPVLGASLLFFLCGYAVLPHLGIQSDEAIFVSGLYETSAAYYKCDILGRSIPLMLLSYLGTLKSLIYAVVFKFFTPGVVSTRLPMLLVGVATIILFFALLRRISGRTAAITGCLLLATDPIFLLTDVFDWGPVALQHLLLVAALFALYRFYETQRLAWLAGGCFAIGLGMWDKALFIWSLGGISLAAVLVFPNALRQSISWRAAGVAISTFAVGAWPLIQFNIERRGETFRGVAIWSTAAFGYKVAMTGKSLEGSTLFGYLVRPDNPAEAPVRPDGWATRLSDQTSRMFGNPRRSAMGAVYAGALLFVPLLMRARARAVRTVAFSLVAAAVIFLAMALNYKTGLSVHHIVLLWPFPHLMAAVAWGEAAQKFPGAGRVAWAVMLAIALPANLLVINEYYRLARRNGGGLVWTDAIYPLSDFLGRVPATQIMPIDWGMSDNLRLLHAGKLPLRIGVDSDDGAVRQWLATPGTVFVSHTDPNQVFPGVNQRLQRIAQEGGFRRELLGSFGDRNGRPIFEVFRYKSGQS